MSPLKDLNCDFKKELGANAGDNEKEKAILGPCGDLRSLACSLHRMFAGNGEQGC